MWQQFVAENIQHLPLQWGRENFWGYLHMQGWLHQRKDGGGVLKVREPHEQSHYHLGRSARVIAERLKKIQEADVEKMISEFTGPYDPAGMHDELQPVLLARAMLEEVIKNLEQQAELSTTIATSDDPVNGHESTRIP